MTYEQEEVDEMIDECWAEIEGERDNLVEEIAAFLESRSLPGAAWNVRRTFLSNPPQDSYLPTSESDTTGAFADPDRL